MSAAPGPFSAIVLAGGRSSRFGRDKLAEPLAGRPLLDHAVRSVAGVARDVVILGPGLPVSSPAGSMAVPRGVTVRFVPDAEPFAGPLVALAAGLGLVREPLTLVVGGDMPTLSPLLLDALVRALEEADGCGAAALLLAGRAQPLPLAIRVRAASPVVHRLVVGGERRLGALLEAVAMRQLDETDWRPLDPDAATLRDVDVPADLPR